MSPKPTSLLLVLAASLSGCVPYSMPETPHVSGVVGDANTKRPFTGAKASFDKYKQKPAFTDSSGRFDIAATVSSSMPPRMWPGVSGIIIGGPSGSNQIIAQQFTPLRDFLLDGASVAVVRSSLGTAGLNIGVWTSLNGEPHVALETAVFPSSSISRNAYPPTIASVQCSRGTRLKARTTYWLVLSTMGGTEYCWADSVADTFPWRGQRNNEGWTSSGCPGHTFEVTGQPVASSR